MTDPGGNRIAGLRRDRGWSQAQLAAIVGVSRSAVAQWETGRAGQVTGHLAKIAAAFDISIDVLLQRTDNGATAAIAGDELALLRLYRECGDQQRSDLLRHARRLAKLHSEQLDLTHE